MLLAAKAKGQGASVFLHVLKYSTGGVLEVSIISYFKVFMMYTIFFHIFGFFLFTTVEIVTWFHEY